MTKYSSLSTYRTWAPETVLQVVYTPPLTAALMTLLRPGQEAPQSGPSSDVWCLAAITHYLSWAPVVAVNTPEDDDDDEGSQVGREGGNAVFKEWEEPSEGLTRAQVSIRCSCL